MVKILIAEDVPAKLRAISDHFYSLGVGKTDIICADNMMDFASKLDEEVDICVIDLWMPNYANGKPAQAGLGILQHLNSSKNKSVKLIAISDFPDEFPDVRGHFEKHGCMLVNYAEPDVWKSAIKALLLQANARTTLDFLIFTALPKEKLPYTLFSELRTSPSSNSHFTKLDVELDGLKGAVILLPKMGLVDAAVTAGKCIELYNPKLVTMSGICAGFEGKSEFGQLLVSELAYEYQSGKWSMDGFQQEPYQSSISEKLRVKIANLLEDQNLLSSLETGWKGNRPSVMADPKFAVFTSGSAVIANDEYMSQVAGLHRKVSGLDMEVYAIHRAVDLSGCQPDVLCAKVVVDMGGHGKDDRIQEYGCFLSAKFVLTAIKSYSF